MRPKLLDLFCGAGGAAKGYADAGFVVTGVDINPQKRYPYYFVRDDALECVRRHGHKFDVIHASPPCQRYSVTCTIPGRDAGQYPDLVAATRDALRASGKPYLIENVPGAPLVNPLILCGTMFPGLRVYRHRLFEGNLPLVAPAHPRHQEVIEKPAGKRMAYYTSEPGKMVTVSGHLFSLAAGSAAMGIDWMTRDELSQAIPPAYTRYLGEQIMAFLQQCEEATA